MIIRNFVIPVNNPAEWARSLTPEERESWDILRAHLTTMQTRNLCDNYQLLRFLSVDVDSLVCSHADCERVVSLLRDTIVFPLRAPGSVKSLPSEFTEFLLDFARSEEEERALRLFAQSLAAGGFTAVVDVRHVARFVCGRLLGRVRDGVLSGELAGEVRG